MNSDRAIADAIKAAQRLLWHRYDLPDAMKVVRLRKFVHSPTVQFALWHASRFHAAHRGACDCGSVADWSRDDKTALGHPE